MNLLLNSKLGSSYKGESQKIRLMTEYWVSNQIYCPNCGKEKIEQYKNNKPVADFYCEKCREDFELKSKKGKVGKVIIAGEYSTMIRRINSETKPNFFFMSYKKELSVTDFFIVPKHFFISEIIEKRKPLSNTARRAGWVGSNILFSKIPKVGQIYYIEGGNEIAKKDVLERWKKTLFLKEVKKSETKGWILDIMNCIEALNKKEFNLKDMYQFEDDLKKIHPENNNIKAKIRQQLQFLRDKKYLEFVGSGAYRLL
jgi:type II restriction enzyme